MADYTYINDTGVIVPDTADIQTTVQNEYRTALGADISVDPSTPQGLLITAETLARDEVVRNNAALANQINPNIAGGIFLDAICALSGLERTAATRSTVSATISGVASTVVPAGSRAQTTDGDLFETTGDVTIGGGGTVSATFQSVEYGPIPALAGTLTQIVTAIVGWEAVTNAGAAVLGTTTQSDAALRLLRRQTLSLYGVAEPGAIVSALYATEGVKSLTFRENVAATTQTIDGISMVAHSIYVCVDGGTDADVAASLLNNKSAGAAWNGGTTVTVTDIYSGQDYDVKFDRPTAVPFDVKATIIVDSSLQDPTTVVKDAILAYVNGEQEGEPGLTVGQDVSCFELASAINRVAPGIYVQNLQTRTGTDPYSNDEIAIAIDEIGTTTANDISVVTS